jgi:uncharacterized protein (TIGR00299 family) protein
MSPAAGRILFVDATQGASGDLCLGALVDLGAALPRIRAGLARMPLSGFTIRSRRLTRCGLDLCKVDVRVRDDVHGRGWRELRSIVEAGGLAPRVRRRALAIFRRLIEAEAAVHGVRPERVHLHEAGGTDAIVDVVGTCIALELLDVAHVAVSPMTTGFGEVRCAHGVYPVPAPATARLVRGAPIRGGDIEAERLTPTGAAILTTLAGAWGASPAMVPLGEGYGAGTRELGQVPNALRMTLGTPFASSAAAADGGEVAVVECTIDDATPQAVAYATERLFDAGALEVFTTAVVMKKGRAGHHLTVLGRPERLAELSRVMLGETSTLGLRYRTERRIELERAVRRVRTPLGAVEVKIGRLDGKEIKAWPEYDSCARIAARRGVPLRDVQQAALAAHARTGPRKRRR